MHIEITNAKKSTLPLESTSFNRGISAGAMLTIAFFKNSTVTSATTPEITASSVLSVNSCRASRARLAPIARRIAISRRRPEDARQQQIRNIHAGDQQHKSHRAKKDEQFRPLRAHQVFLHRNQPHRSTSKRRDIRRDIRALSCAT